MVHSSHRDELARLVERLVEVEEDRARERLLLETIVRAGCAQAAALFRHSTFPAGWIRVLSRGPADLLPDADLVESIENGDFPPELPLGGSVHFAGETAGRMALALGGAADEETTDRVEALLEVMALLALPTGRTASLDSDLLHGPLPEDTDSEPDREENREQNLRLLDDEDRDETAA